MKTSTINIPAGANYLSDVMDELPLNCLFNKGVTGCGGTTIALTNNVATVICVPYVSLAVNKSIQSKTNSKLYPHEVFPVHGDVTTKEFTKYLSTASVPKIVVTYDSLPRVMAEINPSEYHILIDEYHCLFTHFTFRKKAALAVLNNYKAFKSFTFMTATPVYREFTLEELKDVDVVNASWEESLPVNIKIVQSKNGIVKTIKNHIDEVLKGTYEGNYYFFVNSVKFMKKMITNCQLTNQNCRVIYSENSDTVLPIARGKATDEPKKINFITSCGFEGSDFYDEDGKTVIVSDGNNPNTLVDISTQVLQISGRIRDSKYRGLIYHVVSRTRYSEKLSYDQFKKKMDTDIETENRYYKNIMVMPDAECRIKAARDAHFRFFQIDEEAQTVSSDLNASKIDLYNYRILNEDYVSLTNLSKQYEKNNIQVEKWIFNAANPELLPMDDVTNFEETVKELKNMHEHKPGTIGNRCYPSFKAAAMKAYPFIEDAITLLGFDGIERLKYKVSGIKRKILQLSPRTSETSDIARISKLFQLNTNFSNGSVLPGAYIKKTMNLYYNAIGIKKKAIAKDIETYYFVEHGTKSIDGQQQRSVTILSPKIQSIKP